MYNNCGFQYDDMNRNKKRNDNSGLIYLFVRSIIRNIQKYTEIYRLKQRIHITIKTG